MTCSAALAALMPLMCGPTGMLVNRRVFCALRGERTGIPDGMKS